MNFPKQLISKKARAELIKWLEYHTKREHEEMGKTYKDQKKFNKKSNREEQEYPVRWQDSKRCSHVFEDSKFCLKCGWNPDESNNRNRG